MQVDHHLLCISAGLTPQKFIATASVFFAALNIFKFIGVTSLGMLSVDSVLTALAFLGNWLGIKISASLNKQRFLTIMNYLLLSLGGWLLLTP